MQNYTRITKQELFLARERGGWGPCGRPLCPFPTVVHEEHVSPTGGRPQGPQPCIHSSPAPTRPAVLPRRFHKMPTPESPIPFPFLEGDCRQAGAIGGSSCA